jgi:hypothetical protein
MTGLDSTALDVQLDELVDRLQNDPESVAPDALLIRDLDWAGRALRRIARLNQRMAEIEALHEDRLNELAAWFEAEKARDGHARTYLVARLRQFHEARLADDPKAKTIRLPEGDLKARAGQPRWQINDEAFIAWATDVMDDLLHREPRVDRKALKAAFADQVADDGRVVTAAGEIVPGVVVLPPETTYTPAPNPIGGTR